VLIDHNFQLALELGTLLLIGLPGGPQAWHVLDDEETKAVTGLVEQIGLNFDLDFGWLAMCQEDDDEDEECDTYMLANHVETKVLEQLEVKDHGLAVGRSV
jgi:hypothetical protein